MNVRKVLSAMNRRGAFVSVIAILCGISLLCGFDRLETSRAKAHARCRHLIDREMATIVGADYVGQKCDVTNVMKDCYHTPQDGCVVCRRGANGGGTVLTPCDGKTNGVLWYNMDYNVCHLATQGTLLCQDPGVVTCNSTWACAPGMVVMGFVCNGSTCTAPEGTSQCQVCERTGNPGNLTIKSTGNCR